jgi:acetate kinase
VNAVNAGAMNVLVMNSGSSSIKYELFDMSRRASLVSGLVERIGEAAGAIKQKARTPGGDGREASVRETHWQGVIADHRAGVAQLAAALRESGLLDDPRALYAVGHRVVHGGEAFREPALIDDRVLEEIRRQIPLAPLHNPGNVIGIEEMRKACPEVPQAAVFDTAFHQTIPPHAYRYAVPEKYYAEHRVRRYGFHGTSHGYVARQAAEFLGRPLESLNLITLHLGNGASAAAIAGGRSIDTSMGLTPLEGLMMGTRSGDLDPAVVFFLARQAGLSIDELDSVLNRQSGLKGIAGQNDMREVCALADAGNAQAALALEMYAYRIKKYIGAYYAALGRVDAVIFTAGIGEHAPRIRELACRDLSGLGIELSADLNTAPGHGIRAIHTPASRVSVLVVPTDEELEIAEQTVACVQASAR